MTVKEAIQAAANELAGVSVPVPCIHSIGIPIDRALDMMRQCIQVIENAELAAAEQRKQAEEKAKEAEEETPEESDV